MISAGIDIGTNTILMVIGRSRRESTHIDDWEILADVHRIPRLGDKLFVNGFISDEALHRSVSILEEYRTILSEQRVEKCRVVSTAVLRTAGNAAHARSKLEEALERPVEIIEGKTEGELTFLGSVSDSIHDSVMIDIGGGSTEYVRGLYGEVQSVDSAEFGVVSLTDKYVSQRPIPSEIVQEIRKIIYSKLSASAPYLKGIGTQVVGVAGTVTALGMMNVSAKQFDPSEIEGVQLGAGVIHELSERLLSCSLDELHQLEGIDRRRADVLPIGSLILDESMKFLGSNKCVVSTRGLRFGAMLTA